MGPADRQPAEAQERRPGLVLGTAGHIDHGKTALIRALTGVETDRLPEEKARGITIDLGFAALELPDGGELSIVDVPGHERLVRTMVSGASGIDLVMLVVAADEGVMPQTREHVAICDLLGLERGVVALSKVDLVDEEMRELAADEVRELLAPTGLAAAPIVPVSSQSGEGLEALRGVLAEQVASAAPRTPRQGPARLAVDRVFAMKGFGTVVTGTLVGGALAVGDAVVLHPSGKVARVRGLQSHGAPTQLAYPGVRCAANLQGIEVAEIARGEVLCHADTLAPTRSIDVALGWLPGAPSGEERTSIELLCGTAERRARLTPIGTARSSSVLRQGFARIHIDGDPLPALPGDRFIARGFAKHEVAGGTLGGGVILDVAPPHRRRSDPALHRELEILARGNPRESLRERVRRRGWRGIDLRALRLETGLALEELRCELAALAEAGEVASRDGERWLDGAALRRMEVRLGEALDRFHAEQPLRPGMPTASLRGALPDNVPRDAAELALARLEQAGALLVEGDVARRPQHRPSLDPETQSLVSRIRADARAQALEPPALREWAEQLGIERERFRDLVAHLEREGALVRAPGDLWFDRDAVEALRERVVAHLREHGSLDTPSYKTLIGTTRRTAVPLMELFDEQRLTRRSGNRRVLRGGA